MQIQVTKSGYLWNYAAVIFKLGTAVLLLPLVLRLLSSEQLGMWYVFQAVNSFVVLFQSGFSPTFARNIAYCWTGATSLVKKGVTTKRSADGLPNFALLGKLVAASQALYRIVAFVLTALMLSFGSLYVTSVSEGLPIMSYIPAWILYCLAAFLNIYFSYYESLLRGIGDLPNVNKSTIISSITQLIIVALLLLAGCGILSCAIGFLFQGLVFRFLCRRSFWNNYAIKRNLPKCLAVSREELAELFQAISYNAVRDTIVSIANYMVSTATTVISSLMLGLADTGAYSVSLQVVNAIASVSFVALTVNQPALQSAYAAGDIGRERRLTGETIFLFVSLFVVCVILCGTVAMPLLTYIKQGFIYDKSLFIILCLYMFVWRLYSLSATLITNTNQTPYMEAFIISAVMSVALSVLCIRILNMGTYGLVIGPLVSQLVYNAWKWPHEAAKRLGLSMPRLYAIGCRIWVQRLLQFLKKRSTVIS